MQTLELLKKVQFALNMIPNTHKVGPAGESSYEIASLVDRHIKQLENNTEM